MTFFTAGCLRISSTAFASSARRRAPSGVMPALFRKRHDPALARPGLHLSRQFRREIFGRAFQGVDFQVARPEFHKLDLFFERDLQLDVAELGGVAAMSSNEAKSAWRTARRHFAASRRRQRRIGPARR